MNLREFIQSEIKSQLDESILSEKKPSKIVWDTKKISAAKRINVRKWYMKTYPTDELGGEIDKRNTLWDIYTYLSQGVDAYDAIGVADSVVRERVFEKLSKVLGVDYDTIYDMWESVNEGIWPKSKLADRFEFILSDELKKNFKGIFYVVGYDLYHNDKKVMKINPDKDSVNSIVKTLKSKLKESVNENAFSVIEKNIWRAIQMSKYADGNEYLQKMLFRRVTDSLTGNKHIVNKISNIKTKLGKGSGDITITAKVDVVLPDSEQKGTKTFKYTQRNSKVKAIMESVNEKYTGNPGDKLTHKYDKNTEIELIEPTNRGWKVYQTTKGKRKIAYFDKQDIVGDKALFESEQLDEKLITFSNRAPYGQIVFMAGGAGSGKGFAIDNFIDAAGFKVRDVDEMKKALAKLDKLGKFSVDRWYKKYGKNLSDKPDKNGGLSPKEHIEEFVLGKGMSISDIADVNHKDNGLKNPNNVASLHYIVDAMGLKDKWLISMLSGKTNKETLPNLLFDITAKKVSSITSVIKPLIDAGYDSKNIHLIWVLIKYSIAVDQNKQRDRVVPEDIQLNTHEGAAATVWSVLTKHIPKGLNGRIDVILNNPENTLYFRVPSLRGSRKVNGKDKEDKRKIGNSKSITGKPIKVGVVSGFKSLPIKKQGGGIIPEKDWKVRLYNWIKKNAPGTLVYGKNMDISKPEKKDK